MSETALQPFLRQWRKLIEDTLKQYLSSGDASLDRYYGMMQYHMGWVDAEFHASVRPAGKRLRPMLVLLACDALGGDPTRALPASGSVEILHNYSLLHDDIEDLDEVRRHYPTVWKIWGNGQAINAGDGMYACAFKAMLGLMENGVAAHVVLDALSLLTRSCIQLTEGQSLDLHYENCACLTLGEYLAMVRRKTAALFATCLEVGALLSDCEDQTRRLFRQLGEQTGIAYQMLDDLRGIWGKTDETGKASCKDIVQRKKSFPIVTAMGHPEAGSCIRDLYARDADADIAASVVSVLDEYGIQAQCLAMLAQRGDTIQGLLDTLRIATENSPDVSLARLEVYLASLLHLPLGTARMV